MSEVMTANIAGLVSAGTGSRLRQGLLEAGEVYQVGQGDEAEYFFSHNDTPFEKALTYIVPPDPDVENDQGVVVLDLSVKDVLMIPAVDTVRILTNERSNIPKRYGETIDRAAFLSRLGLPALQGDGISPLVKVEYFEQPKKSDEYPFYGTAWAFHLITQGVELGDNELMMITETDSAFLGENGLSIPAQMIASMQGNRRGATAAINVSTLDPSITLDNGLGMVLMEETDEVDTEQYFRHVIESQEHSDLSQAYESGLLIGKNTTRVAADRKMLAINQTTTWAEPSAANNNEYQATDTYNTYAQHNHLFAYTNPQGILWQDVGKFPGLLAVRTALGGLRDAQNPYWGPAPKTGLSWSNASLGVTWEKISSDLMRSHMQDG